MIEFGIKCASDVDTFQETQVLAKSIIQKYGSLKKDSESGLGSIEDLL